MEPQEVETTEKPQTVAGERVGESSVGTRTKRSALREWALMTWGAGGAYRATTKNKEADYIGGGVEHLRRSRKQTIATQTAVDAASSATIKGDMAEADRPGAFPCRAYGGDTFASEQRLEIVARAEYAVGLRGMSEPSANGATSKGKSKGKNKNKDLTYEVLTLVEEFVGKVSEQEEQRYWQLKRYQLDAKLRYHARETQLKKTVARRSQVQDDFFLSVQAKQNRARAKGMEWRGGEWFPTIFQARVLSKEAWGLV